MLTREECAELDAHDELAELRSEFHVPEGVIYLDGNSLGMMPKRAAGALQQTIEEEWANRLIRSWGEAGWFDLPLQLGDRLGRLIGAAPGQTIVCDCTSINIYKALRSAMDMRPDRKVIVSEKSSFPTDLYMLEGALSAGDGYSSRLLGVDGDDLSALIDNDVAAVLLSNVDYRTGKLLDMKKITKMAHDAGAIIIWDLCHSAGVIPLELDALGVDFAVGCTYKYLNGGPGAPAFIYVAERHHEAARQPLSGWWGHAEPFAFKHTYEPVSGIRRFLVGTQSVLGLRGVDASLQLFDQMDITKVREKSMRLCDTFIQLVDQAPACKELEIVSPRDANKRGSQVSLNFENGYPVVKAMIEKGVIGDFREPGIMRFGLVPYYMRFVDLYDAVQVMAECIEREVWNIPEYVTRETVT